MKMKDFLTVKQITPGFLEDFYPVVEGYKERGRKNLPPILRGRWIATLFLEPSTRTRVSFHLSVRALGAEVIDLLPEMSSLKKGESLLDTLKTLEMEGVDYCIIRLKEERVLSAVAPQTSLRIINAGEGTQEHPTQSLGDLITLKETFQSLKGLHICFLGDAAYSRVFRSNYPVFKTEGAEIGLCTMEPFLPPDIHQLQINLFDNLRSTIQWADVIYVLRLQRERHPSSLPEALVSEYVSRFQVQEMPPKIYLMHAGPFERNIEVSEKVVYADRSLILKQVENGFFARAALLTLMERYSG